MNEAEVGHFWNSNAPAWISLSRAGHDIYRDYVNTPAFFTMLPDIKGLKGIDIGCGEGYNTRLLADKGAIMEAIDIAPAFIESAEGLETEFPLGIKYKIASATQLPFGKHEFDFATSFMCLMDIPDLEKALSEAYRVIKPGGFFQFSIEHPCFKTSHLKKIRNHEGRAYAVEIGDYFLNTDGKIEEWIFGDAPEEIKNKTPKFKIPNYHRTLSFWLNAIIKAGFIIEEVQEPYPSDEAIKEKPALESARAVSYFLHIRCRK
jgi:2-polyprenyl-3-methyl-5-hydroxy-6-metoxy-1,4-benzoquinol methylase